MPHKNKERLEAVVVKANGSAHECPFKYLVPLRAWFHDDEFVQFAELIGHAGARVGEAPVRDSGPYRTRREYHVLFPADVEFSTDRIQIPKKTGSSPPTGDMDHPFPVARTERRATLNSAALPPGAPAGAD